MKKIDIKQDKSSKTRFNSPLLEHLKTGKNFTRKELCEIYGHCDEVTRYEIRLISMYYPIISYSTKKGYRMVDVKKLIEEKDRDKINKEIGEIQHTLRELNSRIKMLKKKQKPLIAALKVLEKGNSIKVLEKKDDK